MGNLRQVHVITPGDHFSPRTGSAIPTVVHGLREGIPASEARPSVVVRRDTYTDRYDSVDIIKFDPPINQLLGTYMRWESRNVLSRAAAIICVRDELAEQTAQRLPGARRERIRLLDRIPERARSRPSEGSSGGPSVSPRADAQLAEGTPAHPTSLIPASR